MEAQFRMLPNGSKPAIHGAGPVNPDDRGKHTEDATVWQFRHKRSLPAGIKAVRGLV